MKNLFYAVIASLIVLVTIQGCNKAANLAPVNGQLVASSAIVKVNQADTLVLVGAPAKDSIKFTVVPSGFSTIQTKNNKARIVFSKAGNYTVKASDNGGVPATTVINVTDSVATGLHLVASKTTVKTKETDTVTLVGASAKDSIKFSIVPAGFNTIKTKNNVARIAFSKAGSYTISATDNGGIPFTTVIEVTDSVSTGLHLVATKTTVKIKEPDTVTLVGASAKDSIKFSIVPSGFSTIKIKNNAAHIVFKKAGSYTISDSDNGGAPLSIVIKVTDSAYKSDSVKYSNVPLTGDQITLTPGIYKNAQGDTSYLYFGARTRNSYCGTSTLMVSHSQANNNFNINFLSVSQPSPCVIGSSPLFAAINFTQNSPKPLAAGTYPLSVILNGITYPGSFTVNATTITFNWPYTTGVLLSTNSISL